MKKIHLVFAVISVPIDYLMLVAAGVSAYYLRYADWMQNLRPVIFDLDFAYYLRLVFIVAAVWLVVFALAGLYTITFHQRLVDELSKIVFACSTGLMFIIVYIFWQREFFDSRFIILAAWILSIIYISFARLLLRYLRRLMLVRDKGVERVILVGADRSSEEIAALFHRQPELGYRVVERVPQFDEQRLKNILPKLRADEIILADVSVDREIRSRILNFCYSNHLGFKYLADIFDAQSHNIEILSLGGFPLIEIKKTPLDGWGRVVKRVFDIILSLFGIIVFLPFSLPIILLIKLDSPGPIIVKLTRVGKAGKNFQLYKFRSMIKDAHLLKYDEHGNLNPELAKINQRSDGPLFKNENDPRITRFGKWLRKTSLDEIPQLINVLKGEMSLVGPRPHEPEEVRKYQEEYKKLLSIKPGITGLAQISGRSDLTFEEEAKLDLYYIENWSLKSDLQIIFKTIWVVLSRKNVA